MTNVEAKEVLQEQIVIKISDEDYKRIQDIPDVFNSLTSRVYSAIRNGTPLPKGHGRLIDETQIHKCGWNYMNHHAKTDAPTIIKAEGRIQNEKR